MVLIKHLPECPMSTKDTICRCLPCICDALRACEARVREDERSNNFTPDDFSDGMTGTYLRGLDAAREAVRNLQHSDDCYYAEGVLCHCEIKRVISTLDALKEKQ